MSNVVVTHNWPAGGLTRCCRRPASALPLADSVTLEPALVTCVGRSDAEPPPPEALNAAESPADGGTHPATPTPPRNPLSGPYDPAFHGPGTYRPPAIPPSVMTRIRRSADHARTAFPGPLGELLYQDTIAWCAARGLYGSVADRLAIAKDLETRAEHQRGVTFG